MKRLFLIVLLFTTSLFAQESPQTPLGTYAEKQTKQADALADAGDALLRAQLGECVSGDCLNSFGISNMRGGGVFHGFYKDGVGTGFSMIIDEKNDIEIFSLFDFAEGLDTGFSLVYYNDDDTYTLYDYNNKVGLGFDRGGQRYYNFRIVNDKAQFAKHIQPNGEDLGCVGGNCMNGYGAYRYGNGDFYVGRLINRQPSGVGEEVIKSSGRISWGIFRKGKLQGHGVRVWDEYHYYYGEFKDNKMHGQGVLRLDKDTFQAGQWIEGVYQGEGNTGSGESGSEGGATTEDRPVAATPLSEADRAAILACNGDYDCVEALYIAKYEEYRKGASEAEGLQKTADYLLGQDLIYPKLTFTMMMACYEVPSVLKYLPENLRARIKKEAQGVMVDYQKYINSEETKKAIEAKGGKMN
ncbi:hypothetical protein [Gilvibacter sp.]|uniref:hypothetical protein n=1 Tax=Gilvibacter sp. TaxID=2729997 RepID=UPI003F4A0FE2